MKVVILCGGQGTRIRDVSEVVPKPMLPIGGKPILWHIMKGYAHYGLNDFVICLGYKGWVIKDFFLNYYAKTSDVSLTLGNTNSVKFHNDHDESDWKVTLVETGEESQTALRLHKALPYLKDSDRFCLTYGDGVADVNIKELIDQHQQSGLKGMVTGVAPLGRFGEIVSQGNKIKEFMEKPDVSSGMINGGFMVFNTSVILSYVDGTQNQSWETDIMPRIVEDQQLGVYPHHGNWQCIDTPREYSVLNKLWDQGKPFWKVW